MAAVARSVRDLGQRDHAAADAGPDRDPVLGALDAAVSDGARARRCTARRRARGVGRPRLLLARAQPQEGRGGRDRAVGRRVAEPRERAPRGARHRSLHRGCDRVDRVWRAHAARRRQRRTGARAGLRDRGRHQVDRRPARAVAACGRARHRVARGPRARRSQPGLDGARRHAVRSDFAEMPDLPFGEGVPRREDRPASRAAGRSATQKGERAPAARARSAVDARPAGPDPRAPRAARLVRWVVGAASGRNRVRGRPRVWRYSRARTGRVSRADAHSSPVARARLSRGRARESCRREASGLRSVRNCATR